jgi:hypothetical protein
MWQNTKLSTLLVLGFAGILASSGCATQIEGPAVDDSDTSAEVTAEASSMLVTGGPGKGWGGKGWGGKGWGGKGWGGKGWNDSWGKGWGKGWDSWDNGWINGWDGYGFPFYYGDDHGHYYGDDYGYYDDYDYGYFDDCEYGDFGDFWW